MNNVMEELINSFNTLEPMQQMFWGCAGIATLLFLIQFLLTLLGMDHTDMDVDFDGSNTMDLGNGINIFSMKNLVNFIMGFGWAGVCLKDVIRSPFLLVSVAFLVGLSFVAMFVFLYMKTQTERSTSTTASVARLKFTCASLQEDKVRARSR